MTGVVDVGNGILVEAAPDAAEAFGEWCIVEMFGHRRLAGRVTADGEIMKATRLRIDVYRGPAASPAVTAFVAYPASVYCMTPSTEMICRRLALKDAAAPVARWELEPPEPAYEDRADMFGDA